MEKPYGFKEKDIISIAEFIKKGGFNGRSLSESFKEFAKKSGKSAGSVRNLYYALARFSRENSEFTEKYLGGKPVSVEKPDAFSIDEERELIAQIENYRANGVSVRKATLLIAGGDAKLALRYQNKFRSIVTARGKKVVKTANAEKVTPSRIFLANRLKNEIDNLIDRLFLPLKQENFRLRRENLTLKSENDRLNRLFYGKNGRILHYFEQNAGMPHGDVVKR